MAGPLKIAGLLLAVAGGALAASPTPVLSGLYHVGDLGLVDFSMADGRVVGKYKLLGSCPVAPDTPVITGAFEGSVFVGTVDLCHEVSTGQVCPEKRRKYPFIAVWSAEKQQLLGLVHLDPGCGSPVLERGQLLFRPADLSERQEVIGPTGASATGLGLLKGTPEEHVERLYADGVQAESRRNYVAARDAFRQALELDPDHWLSMVALGGTEIELKEPGPGIEKLSRAFVLLQRNPQAPTMVLAKIQLEIACGWAQLGKKREALAALTTAVKIDGAAISEDLAVEAGLAGLRQDPEFRRLVEQARGARDRKPRKQR